MAVAIGKYDIYQATKEFNESQRTYLQNIRKLDDPIEQNKAVKSLLDKASTLSLEGNIYTRQNFEKKVLTYCTSQMYCKEDNTIVNFTYSTQNESIHTDYNRIIVKNKEGKMQPMRVASSTGEINLKLVQHGCSGVKDDRDNVRNGLHISIHPSSYLSDSEMKSNKKKTAYLQYQNDLEIFYRGVKKNKQKKNAGIFSTFRTTETSKYSQIIKYFSDSNNIMCLSFDYFFNGQKFKEACGQTNPFDFGFIHYLDLSIEYALFSGSYQNPTYHPGIFSCCDKEPQKRIKSRNIEIMTWKAYKHLHIFLRLLANSKNLIMLEKLNLSGLHLTVEDLAALAQILQRGKLRYLNMSNTRIPKEGLATLQNAFKNTLSLNILILDDLIFYQRIKKRFVYTQIVDEQFASFLREIAIYAQNLNEIYINWNEFKHSKVTYAIPYKIGSREYMKQEAVQKACLGPLGKECFELVNEILNFKNLKVCQVRQNQLPFDQIQLYAISLKSNQEIKMLDLYRNTEIDELDEFSCCLAGHCCCDCWNNCCHVFVEKACGPCLCCYFMLDDVPHKEVLQSVIDDIARSCQFNRNDLVFKAFYDKHKVIFEKYMAEHNAQLRLDQEARERKRRQEEERLRKELEAKKLKEQEEFEKQLELNRARAGKHLTVQNNEMGRQNQIGSTYIQGLSDFKTLETLTNENEQLLRTSLLQKMISQGEETQKLLKQSTTALHQSVNSSQLPPLYNAQQPIALNTQQSDDFRPILTNSSVKQQPNQQKEINIPLPLIVNVTNINKNDDNKNNNNNNNNNNNSNNDNNINNNNYNNNNNNSNNHNNINNNNNSHNNNSSNNPKEHHQEDSAAHQPHINKQEEQIKKEGFAKQEQQQQHQEQQQQQQQQQQEQEQDDATKQLLLEQRQQLQYHQQQQQNEQLLEVEGGEEENDDF